MGPVQDESSIVYLRPETAQGSYVNFKNVLSSRAGRRSRSGSPRSARASATRSARATRSSGRASSSRWRCSTSSGPASRPRRRSRTGFRAGAPGTRRTASTPARLRLREHAPDELAHYAKKAVDVEYRFPFGWKELEGVHNRGDFDLSRHGEASGETLDYFDPATEERFIPWIVETAAGADRAAFTFLIDSYREEEVRGETRVSLALHPELAPYKVAVLPAAQEAARDRRAVPRIKADLKRDLMAVYDDTAAIGKLYRRQDEIGTPWCITVDVDSLDDRAGDPARARHDGPGADLRRPHQARDPRASHGRARP